ncbi:MAG: hybrid sensor histidine kinase/response regulator [Planctomycetes bacterium]|nr:hybrid sensor histidine kinase/response regulator [Planctomycetota bacterium]
MSSFGGFDLFELFRAEIETHGAALNEGLLRLEKNPADVQPVDALMRAAHSIKGAARVIGLDLAVDLAHHMEDCLVSIQKKKEACTPERVEQLLGGTDILTQLSALKEAELPEWKSRNAAEINSLVTALSGAAHAAPVAEKPAAPMDAAPKDADNTATKDAKNSEPAREFVESTPVPAPTPLAPPRPSPKSSQQPLQTVEKSSAAVSPSAGAATEVRTVRVNAENLDRMMRLAGESMVEGKRFPQIRRGLREMKSQLRFARDSFESAVKRRDATEIANSLSRLAGIEGSLTKHAEFLENVFRRTEEVGTRLYHEVIGSRMRPFGDVTAGHPRMIRDLAKKLGKKVQFDIEGADVAVDRDVLARLEAPLNHMLRNAVDHGVELPPERLAAGKSESAHLRLQARHHAGMLEVRIRDDGRGIDPDRIRAKVVEKRLQSAQIAAGLNKAELLEFLFLPGFSTASQVTEVSGRGVGLDVVSQSVREIGGSVRLESQPGQGSEFILSLPITLSVIRALTVRVCGESYAFPLARIERIVKVDAAQLVSVEGRLTFQLEDRSIGLLRADDLFGLPAAAEPATSTIVHVLVLGEFDHPCGLVVDQFLGEQDLVVRKLDPRLGKTPFISSAAIDDEGGAILIMDVEDLLLGIRRGLSEGGVRGLDIASLRRGSAGRKRILVVDDSITVREVERQMLARLGYEVQTAVDGVDGFAQLKAGSFDLLVTDVDMPRMNGIEFVKALRRESRFANLPVAIVSYKDRAEDRAAGMEAGANAYLTKGSFQDQSFIQTIVDLIGEAQS